MLALVHFDSVDDMIKYMEHEHEVSHSDNWSPCFGDVGICSAQQGHPLDRDPREVETAGSFLHDSGFARQMVPQRHGAGHPVPTAEAREPPAGRRHLSGRGSSVDPLNLDEFEDMGRCINTNLNRELNRSTGPLYQCPLLPWTPGQGVPQADAPYAHSEYSMGCKAKSLAQDIRHSNPVNRAYREYFTFDQFDDIVTGLRAGRFSPLLRLFIDIGTDASVSSQCWRFGFHAVVWRHL
ncbi:hypothetical protein PG990_004137 [Apiospora arundinis]